MPEKSYPREFPLVRRQRDLPACKGAGQETQKRAYLAGGDTEEDQAKVVLRIFESYAELRGLV
jgi:hypothetical protein